MINRCTHVHALGPFTTHQGVRGRARFRCKAAGARLGIIRPQTTQSRRACVACTFGPRRPASCVTQCQPAQSTHCRGRQVVPHGHASQRIGGPVGSPPNTAAQAPGHDRMRGIVDKHGPTSSIQSSPSGPAVPLRLRHSQCKTLLQGPRHLIIYYLWYFTDVTAYLLKKEVEKIRLQVLFRL